MPSVPSPPFSLFSPGDERCLWACTWDSNKEVNSRFGQAVKSERDVRACYNVGRKNAAELVTYSDTSCPFCFGQPCTWIGSHTHIHTPVLWNTNSPQLGSFSSQLRVDRGADLLVKSVWIFAQWADITSVNWYVIQFRISFDIRFILYAYTRSVCIKRQQIHSYCKYVRYVTAKYVCSLCSN